MKILMKKKSPVILNKEIDCRHRISVIKNCKCNYKFLNAIENTRYTFFTEKPLTFVDLMYN